MEDADAAGTGGSNIITKPPSVKPTEINDTPTIIIMGSTGYKFEGWMGLDKEAAKGKMVWQEFEPKPWEETDVDIKVTHCGICGSDMHTLRSGWVSQRRSSSISRRLLIWFP